MDMDVKTVLLVSSIIAICICSTTHTDDHHDNNGHNGGKSYGHANIRVDKHTDKVVTSIEGNDHHITIGDHGILGGAGGIIGGGAIGGGIIGGAVGGAGGVIGGIGGLGGVIGGGVDLPYLGDHFGGSSSSSWWSSASSDSSSSRKIWIGGRCIYSSRCRWSCGFSNYGYCFKYRCICYRGRGLLLNDTN